MKRRTRGERVFILFDCLIVALFAFFAVYPFWYVIVASFSQGEAVITGKR